MFGKCNIPEKKQKEENVIVFSFYDSESSLYDLPQQNEIVSWQKSNVFVLFDVMIIVCTEYKSSFVYC